MKHKVERSLVANTWLVLDPQGCVVYETNVWAWAVDDAVARHYDAARGFILHLL